MTTPAEGAPQILLVDDNATNLQVLYQTLDGHGYRLLAARSGRDALAIAERARPDLVLLDVMMPDQDGFATCAALKANERTRDIAVIFLSALTEAVEKVRGLELGAVDFINKPFQAAEVLARVATHLRIRTLERDLRRRNQDLEHELSVAQELLREARDRSDGVLYGDSSVVDRLRDEVRQAAASDVALLISGPPGSDHEAVARAVHHQSARARRAIICVNSLSMAPQALPALAETGAVVDVGDKLRLAHGGTLYVEAVQLLPHEVQRGLADQIRAMAEARHGGVADALDVRVIVSTTRPVDDEVEAGRLVADLQRAFGQTIDLPPLRSRLDDLPALAARILHRYADQAGRPTPLLTDASLARLKAYRWPGNLRELRNVLGAALATSDGPWLEVGDHLLDNGMRVGSYTLIERIGSGGMGEVWLARHRMLARPAAVKLIRESVVGVSDEADGVRQRFAREAHATAELQSPHTVQLFDFGTTETGSFYYVMERLHGLDLQRLVQRHGPQPEARVVSLLQQACLSLAEAHALGLVHRDVKPANLFVCRLGREYDFLKVLDFGVVSWHGHRHDRPMTVSGRIIGTPQFLAPELVSGRDAFDGRADIYSLGCVAYWLLTGQPPFDAKDIMTLLMHHATTPPPPPSSKAPAVSAAVDALVLECLAKDPAGRPASADVLREKLAALSLSTSWDQAQARAWWDANDPEATARAPRPNPSAPA